MEGRETPVGKTKSDGPNGVGPSVPMKGWTRGFCVGELGAGEMPRGSARDLEDLYERV